MRGSCVSACSRCGSVRILKLASEPSAGIVRFDTLSSCGAARTLKLSGEFSAGIAHGEALSL